MGGGKIEDCHYKDAEIGVKTLYILKDCCRLIYVIGLQSTVLVRTSVNYYRVLLLGVSQDYCNWNAFHHYSSPE